ncbi:hypothetical protein EfmAA290_14450 [Enterococcus faecium]|nr:hypothetical protein EfmAA290_14450 [Enterococcus faecium]
MISMLDWAFEQTAQPVAISTRKVTKTVELLTDGATVSKSFVSNLMKQLDPFVFEWRNRSLEKETVKAFRKKESKQR